MNEKVLQNKKNGMKVLVLTTLSMLAATALVIFGGITMDGGDYTLGAPVFASMKTT